MLKNTGNIIKEHIRNNRFFYLSLFIFYIAGIILGAASVNDLDYQQKDEMVTFFNGFIKLLDGNNLSQLNLFKVSLIDNLKLIFLFWVLGFTIIGFPMYYVAIGMRGFSTGFSSGIIMGVLGTKGILISTICFVPKEIILVPCLAAMGVNGIKLSWNMLKTWLKKSGSKGGEFREKFTPYSITAVFFTFISIIATLIEAFVSSGLLKFLHV